MKLYERRDIDGRIVEWWTQRNNRGFYFSIFRHSLNEFTVVINSEDANRIIFATATTFLDAEKKLREAEKKYA